MNQVLQMQQNKYLEMTVQTATPAQLLLMLYDGAIRFCKLGIEGIKENDIQKKHVNLTKAQNIVYELIASLDRSIPISDSLLSLYDYFIHRLTEANLKKDVEPAEEVLGYLVELKQTWAQAAASVNKHASGVTHG
jgi:flagellar protein FliS